MRLLLDSHAIMWWVLDDKRLPATARRVISDPDCQAHVSIASVWEIAIKLGIGKLPEAGQFIADLQTGAALPGFDMLPITASHAVAAGTLEIAHKDPFDRMLIAQALAEGLTLVSNEKPFDAAGISRLWD
jgi:PIN domain nuclease of toxin-antitoxin system